MLDDDMYALLHQTSQAMNKPVSKQAINRSAVAPAVAARKQKHAENPEPADLLLVTTEHHDDEESQWNKKGRKGPAQKTFRLS